MAEKNFTLGFSNERYCKIEKIAKDHGLSISQFIQLCISEKISIKDEFEEKYSELIKNLSKLESGAEFTIKDDILWGDNEWEKISRGVKLALGKQFFKNRSQLGVKDIGYGQFGIMRYRKQ